MTSSSISSSGDSGLDGYDFMAHLTGAASAVILAIAEARDLALITKPELIAIGYMLDTVGALANAISLPSPRA